MRSIDIVITISQCITPPKAPFLGHSCVGYQNKALAENKQALACGFISIGAKDGDGMYLTELIPTCEECWGDIIIEILDPYGYAKMESNEIYSYFYNSERDNGWYDYADNLIGVDVNDVFFPVGTGLWITGVDGTTWNTSGQVYDKDKSIPLAENKQMLCNPYPAPIMLDRDITVTCDECWGDVIIEMLDPYGYAKMSSNEIYSYFYNSERDNGWYDYADNLVGVDVPDVQFDAAQGLWVTGVDGTTFNITCPIK